MRIRPARSPDLAAVRSLLEDSDLPLDGVEENFRNFIVAEDANAITGVIGLEIYGHTALLRSAAVSQALRGTGVGTRLVENLFELAAAQGVQDIYLLTTTATKYFPKFGFAEARRADAPESLHASREFQGACPDTATLMKRTLVPPTRQ